MGRQYSRPLVVALDEPDSAAGLERIDLANAGSGSLSEGWIQGLLFRNPGLLPLAELEPAFAPAFPICRELSTRAGPIDLLFASPTGQLTIVECKLWRNPEARREVLGQILDYAKDVSRWTYDELLDRVRRALSEQGDPIYARVSESGEAPEVHEFADAVARNLRRGRFLLIIAGDGIREGVEQLADYLQSHAHLHFSLALVELALYRLPEPPAGRLLVQPRIVARTVEIERAVVRLDDGVPSISPSGAAVAEAPRSGRRTSLTEEGFFEALTVDEPTKALLKDFLTACEGIGLETEITARLHVKLAGSYNFGAFSREGTFRNYSIVAKLRNEGRREIGVRYLTELAELIPGAFLDKHANDFLWTVRAREGELTAATVLSVAKPWLALIERTKQAIEAPLAEQHALEGGA